MSAPDPVSPVSPLSPPPAASNSPAPGGGDTWQLLADFPASGAFQVTSAAAAGDGFVAVGYGAMPNEDYFGRHQGIVWRSSDGKSWAASAEPAFQFVTPEHVVAQGDSLFVFGTIATCATLIDEPCVETPESGWAVWRSVAGGPWERLPQLEQMQYGTVDGVISTDMGLVAFGWTGEDGSSAVWSSGDGATWTATSDLASVDQLTAMARLPATGALMLFGTRYSAEIDDIALLGATSSDGAHFAPAAVPALGGTTVHAVAAGNAGVVAVGDTEELEVGFTAVALHSADGSKWAQTSAVDGSFAGRAARFVHAAPNGYVAIGVIPAQDQFGVLSGTSWFSPDGLSWRSVAEFGEAFTDLEASAAGTPGVVAFGYTEEEPDDETVTSSVSAWLAPAETIAALR